MNKTISLTIFVIFVSISLITLVTADQKVVSSENDFVAGSFSNMQLNLNPSNTCDASRYLFSGYDFPIEGSSGGTCKICDGLGNIENAPDNIKGPSCTAVHEVCQSGTCNTPYTTGWSGCTLGNNCGSFSVNGNCACWSDTACSVSGVSSSCGYCESLSKNSCMGIVYIYLYP